MKDKVKEMIKNVIEENAIQFKTSTSDALYNKIGNRLKDEYKTVAKKMFNSLQEAAPSGTSISQGIGSGTEEVSAAVAPPGGGPSSRDRRQSDGPEDEKPEEYVPRPLTTPEQHQRLQPRGEDYDSNGDGKLDNLEKEMFESELRRWYDEYVRILQQWHRFRYQGNQYAPKFKPPSWRQVRDGAYQSIPLDPDTQRIRRRRNRS